MHLIWYLLYPFRRTLDPPKFRHENPIRRAFYRHGALTARYWLPAMLASVTIGVILSYPTVFMSSLSSGAANGLPHHVWTGSISFESRTEKQPDLEMRQIWLQGDYMQALNKSLIRQVFDLQQLLLQGEVDRSSATDASNAWGIQSPTAYWDHSSDLFEADPDPLKTIATDDHYLSLMGYDIQPLSAFGGKTFHSGKLTGADALIITLVNHQKSTAGETWQRNLAELSAHSRPDWRLGVITDRSRIYEYKFQPFSFRQYWALIGAYLCMVFYVTVCLRRLKAFRSRSGLVVTAITQMTTSILASFTICGLLRINLDQIPQEAYPFVVLAIGLENIFRLINAVLAYPPEMATNQRIANGVADIGGSSLVSAAQNLALLWTLSLFVSPGVAAFCAFASIALLFDFFFLITFFVAVLNVDIKRLELQDSLSRSKSGVAAPPLIRRPQSKKTPDRQLWIDALLRGRVPFSTRMAGSVITLTFVMALNWHFSDHSISALRTSPWSSPVDKKYLPTPEESNITNETLIALSSAGSASSNDVAAQFMHVIKPGVQSFTARIYDPVVVILSQADRAGIPLQRSSFLHVLRGLAMRHFYPFALAVVFMIAFTTVLMNFLLWDERIEIPEMELSPVIEGPISCSIVGTTHSLDIIRLAASQCGRILSVGLDKAVSLVSLDHSGQSHSTNRLHVAPIGTNGQVANDRKPIEAVVNDPGSDYFAALDQTGLVMLGKSTGAMLSSPLRIDSSRAGQRPIMFDYASLSPNAAGKLLVLYSDCVLYELSDDQSTFVRSVIANEEGDIAAAILLHDEDGRSILSSLTRLGSIYSYKRDLSTGTWLSQSPDENTPRPNIAAPSAHDAWLYAVPGQPLLLVCTPHEAMIVHAATLCSYATISIGSAKRHSIRILCSEVASCTTCGAPACSSISIAYTETNTLDLKLFSYTAKTTASSSEPGHICMSSNSGCSSITFLSPSKYSLSNAGAWESTASLVVAGVRRASHRHLPELIPIKTAISSATKSRPPASTSESPLRRRRRISASEYATEAVEEWEMYLFTHEGNLFTFPVKEPGGDGGGAAADTALWADVPGPVARLAEDMVGVAVGNRVVVVRVHENPDLPEELTSRGGTLARERRQSGGLDKLLDRQNGRDGLGGSLGLGVRRSGSRSKRGGIGMTKGKRRE